jgi:ADP-ribose diphosphatase
MSANQRKRNAAATLLVPTHPHNTTMADRAPNDAEILLEAERFRVVRRRRKLADATTITRDVVEHPGAVVIVPLLDEGRVCLVRNYRIAVDATLVELPAGTLEPGESPAATAARELAEETGYSASDWQKLGELLMSPGILHERTYMFVATGLSSGKPAPETGEEIEPLVVSYDESLAMIENGRIQDAKTVAALLLYDRLRRT